ncbi:MAG: leucyl aminopeptidase family protein [Coxiellaceae bacterium]|jgi:leucyl aminopeptidase|nr:leucyl aminopeptidase family protein [Coxiellaceae bacterium]
MLNFFVAKTSGKTIPIVPICEDNFERWYETQSDRVKNIILANRFLAKAGSFCFILDLNGYLEKVLLGLNNHDDFYSFGVLPKILPKEVYEIVASDFSLEQLEHAAIGWGMGNYQFKHYKKAPDYVAKLFYPKNINISQVTDILTSIFLIRDLINTPAGDLDPEKLAEAAINIAYEFDAKIKLIKGKELAANFPAIYAVGRASKKEPILIDLHYGAADAPKIILVGKGVCFDGGGLQMKTSAGMNLMKKDMAGAAHALGLARLVMAAQLPINLRVIIPAVENLISGDVLKPGDIIKTRKGLSLEVANTDAEGRLILADALAYASEWQPKLILDFATLTMAARVALGSDITALFANDDKLAEDIIDNMSGEQEPVWRMPIYTPYLEFLKSEMADFKNVVTVDYINGGAIIAALVLQQFIDPNIQWAHFDMNAYNTVSRAARPEGGEAVCLRGLFKYLDCFRQI